MVQVFLLLGGNLGDRYKTISRAKDLIGVWIGPIHDESSVYESEPWGFDHENKFLNQVVIAETGLSPETVLKSAQNIEQELGRLRDNSETYTGRTIDVDILFFGDLIIDREHLQVPHPLLHERRFTLQPLVEIAPSFTHPVFHKTMQQLLKMCPDDQEAIRVL
jgi:2-amino-4-hydroxy-6-hydroxymethyldihydropteridine diphosphokinase